MIPFDQHQNIAAFQFNNIHYIEFKWFSKYFSKWNQSPHCTPRHYTYHILAPQGQIKSNSHSNGHLLFQLILNLQIFYITKFFCLGPIYACWIPLWKPYNILKAQFKNISKTHSKASKTIWSDLNFQKFWFTHFKTRWHSGLGSCPPSSSASSDPTPISSR